mmetsp:Transcript_6222/g.16639  ORF Transcript_6222/g.16639 Transcript_6222/m.16639 type:complete len:84 (+) Transcript_6222:1559-1810(+)
MYLGCCCRTPNPNVALDVLPTAVGEVAAVACRSPLGSPKVMPLCDTSSGQLRGDPPLAQNAGAERIQVALGEEDEDLPFPSSA